MDIYHIWADLRTGVSDAEFADDVRAYLQALVDAGSLAGFRITRRKLGLGGEGLGDFHLMLEFEGLAELDRAFGAVAARADPLEGLHHAVNGKVASVRFALYRDFPDAVRERGSERF